MILLVAWSALLQSNCIEVLVGPFPLFSGLEQGYLRSICGEVGGFIEEIELILADSFECLVLDLFCVDEGVKVLWFSFLA